MRGLSVLLFLLPLFAADDQAPFSHKKHAPLKLKCAFCHSGAQHSEHAKYPAVAQCRVCHVGMKDREFPSPGVFQLPDFVSFSHAKHAASKIECRSCHRDVMVNESDWGEHPPSMKWCVSCHRQRHAKIACNTCHELGQ